MRGVGRILGTKDSEWGDELRVAKPGGKSNRGEVWLGVVTCDDGGEGLVKVLRRWGEEDKMREGCGCALLERAVILGSVDIEGLGDGE
ncbi:hypothetical protein Tco_1313484 [Tanacetum coccineum]